MVCASVAFVIWQVDAIIADYYKNTSVKEERQECLLSGESAPVLDPEASTKLTLHAAGVQCKDVSRQGTMQGDAGKCMPSQSLWLHERSQYDEDVIMNECTPLWDPRLLANALGNQYKVITFTLDAHMHMGDLIVRERRLTTAFNQSKVFLIADPTDVVDIFGRMPGASPELLWWGGQDEESIEYPTTGSVAQGVNSESDYDWTEMITMYQRDRLPDYHTFIRKMVAEARVQETDMHMFDLDQNCPMGYKGSTSEDNPRPLRTLISHGTIWNTHLKRPLLASEWLVAHGVPGVQGKFGPEGPVDLVGMMASGQVTPGQMKSMVGNGWHLPTIGSWLMWVLASTKKYTQSVPLTPGRSLVVEHESHHEVDGETEIEFFSPPRKMRRCASKSLSQGNSPNPSPGSSNDTPSTLWRSEVMPVVLD